MECASHEPSVFQDIFLGLTADDFEKDAASLTTSPERSVERSHRQYTTVSRRN